VAAFTLAGRAARGSADARGSYLATSVDVLAGAADLAAFGATGTALARADRDARRLAHGESRAASAASLAGAVGALLPGLTAIGVCLVTIHSGASIWVAVLSLVTLAAVEAVLPLSGAAVRYAALRGALARVRALLAATPDMEIPDDGEPETGPVRITLSRVGVRYRDAGPAALHGVDLDLPPGRRVAVVGPSGAGKSTLLGTLAGVVVPTTGTVIVTGADDAPERRWRVAGGVLADGYLFHASIRENLTLGRPGLCPAQLAAALEHAGLPGWHDQLDRVVGEDGGALSGGQRQRLLLARALLAPPPVLLLDEPTEGLDPAAADALLDGVLKVTAGHTVVLVTHRLVDLRGFDEILVLVDGAVAQRGSHSTLVEADGWYAQWWAAQRSAEPAYAEVQVGP
jgi:ATP-binding cassette subfamily C protein CydC